MDMARHSRPDGSRADPCWRSNTRQIEVPSGCSAQRVSTDRTRSMASRPVEISAAIPSRAEAVAEAFASARLEGLPVSQELRAGAELVAAGELEPEDLVEMALALHRK